MPDGADHTDKRTGLCGNSCALDIIKLFETHIQLASHCYLNFTFSERPIYLMQVDLFRQ
jgi:hypothetical protein